ncbi:YbhB/YbcL family Raf kinase inhibitor-like protein [Spongiactinospora sp. TRM90649]|uniref:YbhB/YbcL family Raf kinase inhibitor-like protein n=1 Tax=Spongiactinospora sp. TRM90649 TaxID=3031114 RepID=UPI0023FA3D8E|nr:YbhB/YbcL family Raf kinase inhibitor-like protein [Spongiactinospora sp. TRM90649]MDF5756990.1 YbhB/YbcL family Raf kinase inhibitor-like protein [Spongiactinospora sp. TRM90649]
MTIKRVMLGTLLIALSAGSTIAAASPSAAHQTNRAAFTISSSAFAPGGLIPKEHECTSSGTGDPRQRNESPPLSWAGGPAGAQSYAIVMRDLDNFNLIHWVIYDIPVGTTALPQNVAHVYQPTVPAGSRQVYYRGSASLFGYQGPCSPRTINTYEFVVYALNRARLTELNSNSSTSTAARVISNASLGTARITGES